MATAKAVFGGLLSGVGETMVQRSENRRQQAEQLRQEALERVRRQEDRDFQLQRDDLSHQRATEREEADREFRGGLLSRTQADETGRLHGITQSGETRDLGIDTGLPGGLRPSSSSTGGDETAGITMSAEEKRLYDEVKQRYTDPNTNRVDWNGFVSHLRTMPEERGGARWNELADHLTGAIGTNMTEAEAREQAEQEARQRGGFFGEGFGDEDRETWIEQRTRELRGGQQSGSATQAQGGQSAGGTPAGSGTQADPYKAAAQADIDWFLNNAPAGAVIEVDGTLYTK